MEGIFTTCSLAREAKGFADLLISNSFVGLCVVA
jgi:hypothetical protein